MTSAWQPVSTDAAYLNEELRTYAPIWCGQWDIARIRAARDAHARGEFFTSAQLCDAVLNDPNVFSALTQRVSPAVVVEPQVTGPDSPMLRAAQAYFPEKRIDSTIDPGVYSTALRAWVHAELALAGVCFLQAQWKPREDGSLIDGCLEPWPLVATYRDTVNNRYIAVTTKGEIPIVHGDGKWVVIEPWGYESYRKGAIRPIGLTYGSSGYARIDRAGASRATGQPSIWGELPEGVRISSDEGKEFAKALQTVLRGRAWGIRPFGAKTELVQITGQAATIFGDILKSDKSEVFAALCGQDGTASDKGGTYTKAVILEGVLYSVVERCVKAEASAIGTGFLRPWSALNGFDPANTPALRFPLPDPEADARVKAILDRYEWCANAIKALRGAGLQVTQTDIDRIAREAGCVLGKLTPAMVREMLIGDLTSGIVTINQRREFIGLPPETWGNVTPLERELQLRNKYEGTNQ